MSNMQRVLVCSCLLSDAKAGGAPHVSAAAGGAKQLCKMRPDEALKILNIDKDILTKKILDEVSPQSLLKSVLNVEPRCSYFYFVLYPQFAAV